MSNLNHLIGHRFSIELEVEAIRSGNYPVEAVILDVNGERTTSYLTFRGDGKLYVEHKAALTTFPEAPQIPWDECPWAMYAAMDGDGDWFFYSHEPKKKSEVWANPDEKYAVCDQFTFQPVTNWEQSLIKRP